MSGPDDDVDHAYEVDENGRVRRDGVLMPRRFRIPSSPRLNPDGTRTTQRDTERFATELIGRTVADAEKLAQANSQFDVHFVALDSILTLEAATFRIRAVVQDGVVVDAKPG